MKAVSSGESVSAFESETKSDETTTAQETRWQQTRVGNGVIAATGRNPDSVSPGVEHAIHCGKMGYFASVCCSGNQGKERASRIRVNTIKQHEHIDSEELRLCDK